MNSFARLQTHRKYKLKTPGFFPRTFNSDKCQKKSLGLDRLPLIANILRKNPGFHQIYISFFPQDGSQRGVILSTGQEWEEQRKFTIRHLRSLGTVYIHIYIRTVSSYLASFMQWYICVRYHPRFFNRVGHQTTSAYIENKHFFTKSYHRQTQQYYTPG